MQIFKRLNRRAQNRQSFITSLRVIETRRPTLDVGSQSFCMQYKRAQNLVEFIFILPILIFMTLAIFEVSLFWQDVNSVYSLNTEINANVALIAPKNMVMGQTCAAAVEGRKILEERDSIISLNNPTYSTTTIDGNEPFALYKIFSTNNITGTSNPQISLWVDCRNPFENGITTQVEFYHKTLVMKASLPRIDQPNNPIVIIPEDVFIASPKLNTIRHY